jgi:N-acetylglucosaminyldiphosphoundecaprenol N-acetyl-beta-D-mannosaminyltransferase
MLGRTGRAAYIVTPNPESVWASRSNPALKEAINGADMVIPDGIGVIYASRILGRPLKERVTGYDLSLLLLESLSRTGGKVFLLGAKPGVAERAAEELKKKYGG